MTGVTPDSQASLRQLIARNADPVLNDMYNNPMQSRICHDAKMAAQWTFCDPASTCRRTANMDKVFVYEASAECWNAVEERVQECYACSATFRKLWKYYE